MMIRRSLAALLAAGLTTLLAAHADAAGVAIENVTPAFYPGNYVALAVDPRDPDRVAITTDDGVVSLSDDGGRTARTAHVLTPREYQSAPLRSQPPVLSLLHTSLSGRALLSGLAGEPPGTRYFLYRLQNQLPVAKWQHWMAVDDPATAVLDVAWLPPASLLAATASGLFVGGARALGFTQLIGAPHPRGAGASVRAVDVDPADPRRVLAATADGVLVSTDGGHTFAPHPDLDGVEVRRFYRDPGELTHLFALSARTLFQSRDGGRHFRAAFSTRDGVHAIAVDERGAYVATGRGLMMPRGVEPQRWHPGDSIVGVIALGGGALIAASDEGVWLIDDGAGTRTLLRAGGDDPIVRLEGGGAGAYVLTRHNLYRLTSTPAPRLPAPSAPRLLLSLPAVERAVLARTGLGAPSHTRLGAPWWSFLLPSVTVALRSATSAQLAITYDALLPFPERLRHVAGSSTCCGASVGASPGDFTVLMTWNLAGLVSRKQPTYPFGIVETNLRAARSQILSEVRWRYRDAAALATGLAQPPTDDLQRYQWESRLDEQAAYLEAMTGRRVIAVPSTDP